MLCRYEIRSLALHHGNQIETGHYNALIVNSYKVFLIDDEVTSEVTDDWLYHAERTVYLIFYTKKGSYYSLTAHLENQFYPLTESEKKDNEQIASQSADRSQERNSTSNSSTSGFTSSNERISQVYDASQRHKVICSHKSYCFDHDLKGEDFKTLEYPVENTSYLIKDPGWLNDKIVDAYILLLVEGASKKGICVRAFNCFFYTCLKKVAIHLSNEQKFLQMIFEGNSTNNFEEYDYILIPINSDDHRHWTTMVLDIWTTRAFFITIQSEKAFKTIQQ